MDASTLIACGFLRPSCIAAKVSNKCICSMNANSWSPRSVRTGRENDAHPKEESLSKSTFPPLEGLRVVVALSGGNWKLPEMIPRQPHQARPYGGLAGTDRHWHPQEEAKIVYGIQLHRVKNVRSKRWME